MPTNVLVTTIEKESMRTGKYVFLILGAALSAFFGGAAAGEDPNPATIHSDRGAWPLYRQWNLAETRHFSEWIGRIYDRKAKGTTEQRLAKLEHVLSDPDMNLLLDPEFAGTPCNPQPDMDSIMAMHRVVDCHKLSMSLGAYYSCRRGLPFMFSHVRAVDGGDLRTAASTYPVGTVSSFDYSSARQFFVDATAVPHGQLRAPPLPRTLSDTCPVALTPEHLVPGCLYYLDGHVLILAKVEPGNVRFLDATTSYTRDLYTFNGLNVVTGIKPRNSQNGADPYAGCFCGFRVFRYPIAETDADGKVKHIRRRTDAEMAEFGFSTEQYEKMEELVKNGKITEDGRSFGSMHQLIRYRLRGPGPISVTSLLHEYAARAKEQLIARDAAVQEAWAEVRANGPIEYPERGGSTSIPRAGAGDVSPRRLPIRSSGRAISISWKIWMPRFSGWTSRAATWTWTGLTCTPSGALPILPGPTWPRRTGCFARRPSTLQAVRARRRRFPSMTWKNGCSTFPSIRTIRPNCAGA